MKKLLEKINSLPFYTKTLFLSMFFFLIALIDSIKSNATGWEDLHIWGKISISISMLGLAILIVLFLIIPFINIFIKMFKK